MPTIERNLKHKFGRFIEIDDERDRQIWIDLWRRLERGPEPGDAIHHLEWKVPLQETASLVGRGVHLNLILARLPWRTFFVTIPFFIVATSSIMALSTLNPDTQLTRFEGVHLYLVFGMVLAYGYFAVYTWITVGRVSKMSRSYFIERAALRGNKADDDPDGVLTPDEVNRLIDDAESKLIRLRSIESQSRGGEVEGKDARRG
jgi:hypothetical protein